MDLKSMCRTHFTPCKDNCWLNQAGHMEHSVPKKPKTKTTKKNKTPPALKKAPQIAHYKMIIAHIHVLLCFRK